ncbi:MAG TPA: VOC family protein [Streptosporangiaceae bacterium]|jgi:hypothetical protein
MPSDVRLRQVALVARDLDAVAARLESDLGLRAPYADPGIARFGLRNAVYAVGDTFLEVVAPVRDGTTAGRYLDRRGGDAGYMAIFQLAGLDAARARLTALGVRVVWQDDRPDISGTHLHPRDVPGAIVSLDAARPPESWHWAGPEWTGGAPAHEPGGITGITVAATDPPAVARRWGEVLGLAPEAPGGPDGAGGRGSGGTRLVLDEGRQVVEFVPVGERAGEGVTGVSLDRPAHQGTYEICGVRMDARTDGDR